MKCPIKKLTAVLLSAVVTSSMAATAALATEGSAGQEAAPKVSVVNFDPAYGDKQANVAAMADIIREADAEDTDIIVFPELAVTGYASGDVTMPVEAAEDKGGQTAAYFSDLAQEYDMYIVYGAPEKVEGDDAHAYNSAFVCTPSGQVDSYQKMLTEDEGEWCVSGSGAVTFDTEFGKVGLSVGDDTYNLIEQDRAYSADGCFMIASPSALQAEDYTQSYDYSDAVTCEYTEAYDYSNWTDYNLNRLHNVSYLSGLYVASANLNGTDGENDEFSFGGGSMVVGLTDPDTYNQIWDMWQDDIGTGADYVDYIMKVYAGGKDSTEELCTAEIIPSYASHELVAMDIYQPDLYTKWFAELGEENAEFTTEPTTEENPTVAVVNMTPKWADKAANTAEMLSYVSQAAEQGVAILTFPEMILADYAATSEQGSALWNAVVANAESTDGVYAKQIAAAAKQYNMYIIYGTAEVNPEDPQHPYNSAFVATPEGETISYRKIQPVEGDWATWGSEPVIVDTRWGGMGISICMDTYAYPELARYYAAAGCRIFVNPTASSGYAGSNFIYNTALSSIASREGIAVLSSDLVNTCGLDNSATYPGKSTILTTNGISPIYLTEESMTDETMYVAELDLTNVGFPLEDYNASAISEEFASLAADEPLYDGTGAVVASDYEGDMAVDGFNMMQGILLTIGLVSAAVIIGVTAYLLERNKK